MSILFSVSFGLIIVFIVTVIFGMVLLAARPPGSRLLVKENGTVQEIAKEGLFKCKEISHPVNPAAFLRNTLMYLICIGFLTGFAIVKNIPFWMPLVLLGIYFIYMGAVIALYFGHQQRNRRQSVHSLAATVDISTEENILKEFEKFKSLSFFGRLGRALYVTCWDEAWSESTFMTFFRLAAIIVKAPINLLFNCTILPLELPEERITPEDYVSLRFLHRFRCVMVPFCSLLSCMGLLGPEFGEVKWYWWVTYAVIGALFTMGLVLTTSWTRGPKFFFLHVIYAFCISILWIYAASKELVECLSATGSILKISPTVMGILVLAWGNSFGDLVADVAIAKNGAFETAVTAIFSGPVQNVLLTIGAGFLVAALHNTERTVFISALRNDIYLALFVLASVMVGALLLVSLKFDFKIPRSFGFLLLTIYMLYLPCALLMGLGVIKVPFLP